MGEKAELRCWSCRNGISNVQHLIGLEEKPGGFMLCDDCVYLCVEVLDEKVGIGQWGCKWRELDQLPPLTEHVPYLSRC